MRTWERNVLVVTTTCTILLQIFQAIALAGPVKRSSRMIREVYPEIEPEKLEGNQPEVCVVGDVVYGAEEPVPADQPCLKCRCQPPGVQCETIRCPKKPGCRAIHKPNQCCPDYQCECDHEGRTYGNGERLETPPGGECRVCYCQGGELQCAEVSCYIRTDCEGRTVPGQCCPKYDHCPPREPIFDRAPYTTEQTLPNVKPNLMSSWLLTGLPLNTSAEISTTTPVYDVEQVVQDENKIADTDSKTTNNENTTPNIKENSFQTTENPIILTESPELHNRIHIHEIQLVDKSTQTDKRNSDQPQQREDSFIKENNDATRITIQEIIPEIKEIPMTAPPKREVNKKIHDQFITDEESKIVGKIGDIVNNANKANEDSKYTQHEHESSVNDLIVSDTESESSEISEIYHHPPPVLKIGDQLLFLKKGQLVPEKGVSTPSPVITIIGAEGLQRGTEESSEFHEIPSQIHEPHQETFVEPETTSENYFSSTEGIANSEVSPTDNSTNVQQMFTSSEDLSDIDTSQTSHILSLVKEKYNRDYATKSPISAIEDFFSANISSSVSPEISDDVFGDAESNTSAMTESIVNKLKTITNMETTTDVENLLKQIYILDINGTAVPENDTEISSTMVATTENIDNNTESEIRASSQEYYSSTSENPENLLLYVNNSEVATDMNERVTEKSTTNSERPTTSLKLQVATQISTTEHATTLRFHELGETHAKQGKPEEENKEDVLLVEQNPEYPPIPDIMSPQNVDELAEHGETEATHTNLDNTTVTNAPVTENFTQTAETASLFDNSTEASQKILMDVLDIRSNKTIPKNEDDEHQKWLKIDHKNRITSHLPLTSLYADEEISTQTPTVKTESSKTDGFSTSTPSLERKMDEISTLYSTQTTESTTLKQHEGIIDGSPGTQNQIILTAESSNKNVSISENSGKNNSEEAETDQNRSKETMEDQSTEDSGEATTQRNNETSIMLSTEDASVEATYNTSPEIDKTDLVETLPGFEQTTKQFETKNVEMKDIMAGQNRTQPVDVEIIDPIRIVENLQTKESTKNFSNFNDIHNLDNKEANNQVKRSGDLPIGVTEETTTLPKTTEADLKQKKHEDTTKRDPDADIFQQLGDELGENPTNHVESRTTDDDKEAETIFRELLEEETSTSKQGNRNVDGSVEPRERETEVLQRVSDAISKFQLKESKQSLDASILGILRDFFSSQYKHYNNDD